MVAKTQEDPHMNAGDPNEPMPDWVPVDPVVSVTEPVVVVKEVEVDVRSARKAIPSAAVEARAVAALQQEVALLRSEMAGMREAQARDTALKEAGQSGLPWQFYKRPNRGAMAGWIVVSPGGAAPNTGRRDSGSFSTYTAKGFRPLTDYGVAAVPTGYGYGNRDFIPMLQKGGAKEFPVEQVLSYRWHTEPPIAGLTFPSYEEVKDRVRQFMCEDCDFTLWLLDEDRESVAVCLRHLRRPNRDGSHGYSRREASAILSSQNLKAPGGAAVTVAAQGEYEAILEGVKRAVLEQ